MNVFTDCRTVSTGLSKPHTLYIGEHGISIIHTNKLNDEAIKTHYLKILRMSAFASASDTYGET